MCNQNNLTQSLRETARRGLIHFLYIYFLRFFLPLGLFFYYLFFIFSRNWFATHQRTFLLDFVAQITHTQHILSYPPRALHNDDDANKNTTPLFDKTSAASSTDRLHLNQSPRSHFGKLHTEFISRVNSFAVTTNFSYFQCGFTYLLFLFCFFFFFFIMVHTFWSSFFAPLNFSTQATTFLQSSLFFFSTFLWG